MSNKSNKIFRIYKCTNIVNGKKYIGFTNKELKKRIIEHNSSAKNNSNFLLHKAIRKYGKQCFIWETIFESKNRDYILNEMENYFIKHYNTYYENNFGYNMTYGGEGGMLGKKHSKETKILLKISRNNRQDKPMLNKKHSNDAKKKMSIAKLNKKKDDAYKLSCSIRNKKRYENPEKRKILSDAIKLMWQKRKQSLVKGVEN